MLRLPGQRSKAAKDLKRSEVALPVLLGAKNGWVCKKITEDSYDGKKYALSLMRYKSRGRAAVLVVAVVVGVGVGVGVVVGVGGRGTDRNGGSSRTSTRRGGQLQWQQLRPQ